MRVSQLLRVMRDTDDIVISKQIGRLEYMELFRGLAGNIKRDNPINKMHVLLIDVCDDTLYVLADKQRKKGNTETEEDTDNAIQT
mgnify:CR=1 FL=1